VHNVIKFTARCGGTLFGQNLKIVSVVIAFDLYRKGKYEQMREVAERVDPDNSGVSQMLIAIANGALGNRDAARGALKKLSEHKPLASDPAAFLRRHGAIDEIVDALMAGLKKARKVASGSSSGSQSGTL
jgi:hypothetical protein